MAKEYDIKYMDGKAVMFDGLEVPLFSKPGQRDLINTANQEQMEWLIKWLPILTVFECCKLLAMSDKSVCKLRKKLGLNTDYTRVSAFMSLANMMRMTPERRELLTDNMRRGRETRLGRIDKSEPIRVEPVKAKTKTKKKTKISDWCNELRQITEGDYSAGKPQNTTEKDARKDQNTTEKDARQEQNTTEKNARQEQNTTEKAARKPQNTTRTEAEVVVAGECIGSRCWLNKTGQCKKKASCGYDLSSRLKNIKSKNTILCLT